MLEAKMPLSAEEKEPSRRRREPAQRLLRATIVLAAITALFFVLSYIPELSKKWDWLRSASEIAGACDGIIFFVLMYWQLANDRAELLVPMNDATEENGRLLQQLTEGIHGIREELGGLREQLVHVANTRWLADSGTFMRRLRAGMSSAISSEPSQPKPVLRLMRLSGYWRMNERLERAADLLAKFFYPGDTAGQWSDQWEVQMLYAIADRESLHALMDKKAILGKVLGDGPKNYTFRLIGRTQFEPSIGLVIIAGEVAFVSFDESTADPFSDPIPTRTSVCFKADCLAFGGSGTVRHCKKQKAKYMIGVDFAGGLQWLVTGQRITALHEGRTVTGNSGISGIGE